MPSATQAFPAFASEARRTRRRKPRSDRPADLAEPIMACEDNLEFLRRIPDASVQLVVTSPPYNLGKAYEKRSSLEAYLQQQAQVIDACARVLRPSGSICWQVGTYVDRGKVVPIDAVLYGLFKARGLKLRNRIVWYFGHGLHCARRLSGRYETINWWTKSDGYTFHLDPVRVPAKYPGKRHFKGPNVGNLSGNPKGKNPSDVWLFPNVKSNHVEKTVHPCQFPVELVERLVLFPASVNSAASPTACSSSCWARCACGGTSPGRCSRSAPGSRAGRRRASGGRRGAGADRNVGGGAARQRARLALSGRLVRVVSSQRRK